MSVVVGYVPDATGLLAVREAAQQAQWRNTELIVVNVVDAAGYVRPTAADEKTLEAVGELLASYGVRFSIRHVVGTAERASEALLAAADQTDGELIVVGIRRRWALAKAVLGSTAQRVLVDARCPVLSVRASAD